MPNFAELFSVLSNLFLLLPFVTAVRWRRILLATVFFIECFVSGFYHACDGLNWCIFGYSTLKNLDFFFAQSFMILIGIYIVHWTREWQWLCWVLNFVGMFVIVILQITLPGELYVQAGIAFIVVFGIILYWIVYAYIYDFKLPPYDWYYFYLGACLLGMSTMLFSVQHVWPDFYWLVHSLWHIAASFGLHYLIQIKMPAEKGINVAGRIKMRV
jgi:Protein of unknown function (DUF3522)